MHRAASRRRTARARQQSDCSPLCFFADELEFDIASQRYRQSQRCDPSGLMTEKVEEYFETFVAAFLSAEGLQILSSVCPRVVDEPEATVQIFSVIEGMQELRPQAVVDLCRSREGGQFLSFLSECLRAKADLRPDAAELLSILLLDPAITDAFCSDGERVDTLLIAMSQFRKRNPKDTGEDECMANIFDCAACAVLAEKGKKAFLSGQGVELMVRMLRGRLASYIPALAVLSSACTNQGDDGASLIASICCRLVESGALKFLFQRSWERSH